MRNHRNSVGMTMMNSTKQVNKVKPNVNRATNDSLSSPNQPYNQRYLIILRVVTLSSLNVYASKHYLLTSSSYIYIKHISNYNYWLPDMSVSHPIKSTCVNFTTENYRIKEKKKRCVKSNVLIETPFLYSLFFSSLRHFTARLMVHSTSNTDTL